jgi:hypothetical protein
MVRASRAQSDRLERGRKSEGMPPNALIDHWPAACNHLHSLAFRVQQRMVV